MRPFVAVVALLLTAAVAVNGTVAWLKRVDADRLRAVAGELTPGRALPDYRNVDERRFQKARLQSIAAPAVVAFGSSRAMQLTTELLGVPTGRFYNAAMSGATVEDHMALWSVLERQGKQPAVALFSIDPWIFNVRHDQERWLALSDDVDAFLDTAGAPPARGVPFVREAVYRWYQAKELLSWAVLRASVRHLERALRGRQHDSAAGLERPVAENDLNGRQALRADGSLIYDVAFQSRTPAAVAETAARFVTSGAAGPATFEWNDERGQRLERLWRDMRAHGVTVIAYLPPYHPAAWRQLQADHRYAQALRTTAEFLGEMTARVGVRFKDLSDPGGIPCADEEFFDGHHARASCLAKLLGRLGLAEITLR